MILKLNSRFSSGNYTSMVKVLSLDQKRYFLYVFQGRGETVAFRPFLHSLSSSSIVSFFFVLASLSLPPLSLSFSLSVPWYSLTPFFSRKSEGKYFGHVVPIVLSQMPELASYALSALSDILLFNPLSMFSAGLRSFSLRTFPMPGAVSLISKTSRFAVTSGLSIFCIKRSTNHWLRKAISDDAGNGITIHLQPSTLNLNEDSSGLVHGLH